MKPYQAETFLSARLKLFKRHLLEWSTLLHIQRKVRDFALENTVKKTTHYINAAIVHADKVIRQNMRLYNLMVSQKVDLDRMKERHQQEDTSLEGVIKTTKNNSN